MFDFLFPTEPFGGQTLRLVAQAQQGGGDLFDIARTCRNIQAGDKQSWEKAWLDLAQTTEARAQRSLERWPEVHREKLFFSRQSILPYVRRISHLSRERS